MTFVRIMPAGGPTSYFDTTSGYVGTAREIGINTDNWSLHVFDGSTPGGHQIGGMGALSQGSDIDFLTNPLTDGQLLVYNGTEGKWQNSAISLAWAAITGVPTTLAGYGITDSLTTNNGLTGGGTLSSGLTLGLAAIPAGTLLGNGTGGSAAPTALTVSQVKTWLNLTHSDITDWASATAGFASSANPSFTGTLSASALTVSGLANLNGAVSLGGSGVNNGATVNGQFYITSASGLQWNVNTGSSGSSHIVLYVNNGSAWTAYEDIDATSGAVTYADAMTLNSTLYVAGATTLGGAATVSGALTASNVSAAQLNLSGHIVQSGGVTNTFNSGIGVTGTGLATSMAGKQFAGISGAVNGWGAGFMWGSNAAAADASYTYMGVNTSPAAGTASQWSMFSVTDGGAYGETLMNAARSTTTGKSWASLTFGNTNDNPSYTFAGTGSLTLSGPATVLGGWSKGVFAPSYPQTGTAALAVSGAGPVNNGTGVLIFGGNQYSENYDLFIARTGSAAGYAGKGPNIAFDDGTAANSVSIEMGGGYLQINTAARTGIAGLGSNAWFIDQNGATTQYGKLTLNSQQLANVGVADIYVNRSAGSTAGVVGCGATLQLQSGAPSCIIQCTTAGMEQWVYLNNSWVKSCVMTQYGIIVSGSGGPSYAYHNNSSSNSSGNVTFSTSAPSGGSAGDMWFQHS